MEATALNLKIYALGYAKGARQQIELVEFNRRTNTAVVADPRNALLVYALFPQLKANDLTVAQRETLTRMDRRSGHMVDVVISGLPRIRGQHYMFLLDMQHGSQLLLRSSAPRFLDFGQTALTLAALDLSDAEVDALKHMGGLE